MTVEELKIDQFVVGTRQGGRSPKRLRYYRLGAEFGAGEKWKITLHFWRWSWTFPGR